MWRSALLLAFLLPAYVLGQKEIKLNQLGFSPEGQKIAAVPSLGKTSFHIKEAKGKNTVHTGTLEAAKFWPYSEEQIQLANFSDFKTPGKYFIEVDGVGKSEKFEIQPNPLLPLSKGAIKAFYYNRCSYAIERKYGGQWTRDAGHPDTEVTIHSSAASKERPEGFVISSPRGWYDAGDYNKYIVNSGITMHTLYAAYEQFKPFYDTLKVDIPESVQGLPALLDESLWNLRWMLTMQDPNDGGVYHKLTHHGFSGSVQPIAATSPRVVVAKGTAATMDFAAVCAQAARVFKPYEAQLPGLADSCLSAAKYAWEWGKKNPNIPFTNPSGISTGEYGDGNLKDEIFWASVELFISTGDTSYVSGIDFDSYNMGIPSWAWVEPLAWLSMARNLDKLNGVIEPKVVKKKITSLANNLYYEELSSGYHISMGFQPDNFVWGSNSVAANIGMVQLTAYELSGDQRFLDGATNNMDYLLGRNPTGYCYVTGFGRYSPLNPHHRPSESDFDPDPVPGFLVGGPHSGQQDNCNYDSDLPALSYTDEQCSYATNEIAINWNAPLTYLSGGLVYYQNNQR